jgi:hypothetical protein
MEVTGQLHSTVFLPLGKQRRCQLMGGYMDPLAQGYTFWRRERRLFPPIFEPLFIQPVASHCTKWAIRFLVFPFIHSFEVETEPFTKQETWAVPSYDLNFAFYPLALCLFSLAFRLISHPISPCAFVNTFQNALPLVLHEHFISALSAPQFSVLTDIAQYTCWHFFLIRLLYTITCNRDLVIVARVIKNLPLFL